MTRRLVCEVGGHLFAIDIAQVREAVERPGAAAPLPGAPPWVLGLVNVRGLVLPVVDLGGWLGLGRAGDGPDPVCLLLEAGGRRLGALVSRLEGIEDGGAEDAADGISEEMLEALGVRRFRAVGARPDGRPLWHLDVSTLFADVYP
jgi:chemotaxis signal transduction protein